jgi:hypothetical protein
MRRQLSAQRRQASAQAFSCASLPICSQLIGARSADFCTREQQLNVVRFGVFTARLQTVRDRLQTNAVAIKAFVDALLHFVCDLLCSLTRHIFFLPELLNLLYNKR